MKTTDTKKNVSEKPREIDCEKLREKLAGRLDSEFIKNESGKSFPNTTVKFGKGFQLEIRRWFRKRKRIGNARIEACPVAARMALDFFFFARKEKQGIKRMQSFQLLSVLVLKDSGPDEVRREVPPSLIPTPHLLPRINAWLGLLISFQDGFIQEMFSHRNEGIMSFGVCSWRFANLKNLRELKKKK